MTQKVRSADDETGNQNGKTEQNEDGNIFNHASGTSRKKFNAKEEHHPKDPLRYIESEAAVKKKMMPFIRARPSTRRINSA